jgi:hypothetical protein
VHGLRFLGNRRLGYHGFGGFFEGAAWVFCLVDWEFDLWLWVVKGIDG